MDYYKLEKYDPIIYLKRNTGISQYNDDFFVADPEYNKEVWYPFQNRNFTSLLNKEDIVSVDKFGMMRCNRHHIQTIPEFMCKYNKGNNIEMKVHNLNEYLTSDKVTMVGIFTIKN